MEKFKKEDFILNAKILKNGDTKIFVNGSIVDISTACSQLLHYIYNKLDNEGREIFKYDIESSIKDDIIFVDDKTAIKNMDKHLFKTLDKLLKKILED